MAPVGSKNWIGRRGITPPLNDNSAGAHPIARGTSLAPRAGDLSPAETAGRCPIPLGVEMVEVVAQCPPQRPLAEKDHFGQALLLDRPDPALRVGIQVRAACRQRDRHWWPGTAARPVTILLPEFSAQAPARRPAPPPQAGQIADLLRRTQSL